jgi:hypothetical protein
MNLKEILEIFLYSNYRTIENAIDVHKLIKELNNIFYFNLSVWFIKNYEIITHKEIFISNLFISDFIEHRQKASELLKDFNPYSINNILDNIKGKVYIIKNERVFKPRLKHNIPRILKSSIKNYIESIDNIDIINNNKKYLRQICCRCRINIDKYKNILFNNEKYENNNIYNQDLSLENLICEYEKEKNIFLKKIIDFI